MKIETFDVRQIELESNWTYQRQQSVWSPTQRSACKLQYSHNRKYHDMNFTALIYYEHEYIKCDMYTSALPVKKSDHHKLIIHS